MACGCGTKGPAASILAECSQAPKSEWVETPGAAAQLGCLHLLASGPDEQAWLRPAAVAEWQADTETVQEDPHLRQYVDLHHGNS